MAVVSTLAYELSRMDDAMMGNAGYGQLAPRLLERIRFRPFQMLVNQYTAIVTSKVVLVPYR